MKKSITNISLLVLLGLLLALLSQCTSVNRDTQSALEQRLDTLLNGMTMQEKIEQLYYLSDGNDRLDLLIDPRIGRAPETIGEDPFLGGRISEAFVFGQNTTSGDRRGDEACC